MTESRANGRRTSVATALAHARGARPRTATASPDHDGPIRVVLADDSYLIREALREILAPVDQVELVATFADGDSLLAARGDRSAGRDHHRHPHAARG